MKSFASDNFAGVHPKVLEAIGNANGSHVPAYGNDFYTKRAKELFQEHFGMNSEVFFVFNGTGANVCALRAITNSFHSIITAETSHLHVDECGAPEANTRCKILAVPTTDGKLTIDLIQKYVYGFGDQHHSQPRVVAITQSTEMGTVYTPQEIKSLADFAHDRGMLLFMDGARISNAAAFLGVEFKEMVSGVDVFSFGGTKNGLLGGEAVVFLNKELARDFPFIRKQQMQLSSKMRYLSAQFIALLSDGLWYCNAKHANEMAQKLARGLQQFSQVFLTQPVQANGVFAIIPPVYIPKLQKEYFFYIWNEQTSEVRWMTSFDTTEEDIEGFLTFFKSLF